MTEGISRLILPGANLLAVTMQLEAPLTLILSPLRAGRGELERTRLGSLFGDRHAVPTEGSPLPFEKGEGQGARPLN